MTVVVAGEFYVSQGKEMQSLYAQQSFPPLLPGEFLEKTRTSPARIFGYDPAYYLNVGLA